MNRKPRILPDYIINLDEMTIEVRSTGEITVATKEIIDFLSRDYWKEKRTVKKEQELTVSYDIALDNGESYADILTGSESSPEDIACRKEAKKELRLLEKTLTDKEKESVYYIKNDIKMKDIVNITGVSRQSLTERRRKAVSKLQKQANMMSLPFENFKCLA